MARLAVLTDRLPDDASWKGAYTWEIIRGLAESQHEVIVFTTEDPERVQITHPRLTVARPAPAWTVDRMPKWAQALIAFQPEVIHTFGLKRSNLWPSLTVWPYLDALCKVLKGVKRVSTMFDVEDFDSGAAFHAGAHNWTVFSRAQEQAARAIFSGSVELVPLDNLAQPFADAADEEDGLRERGRFTFIPAPVSEWEQRGRTLALLAEHLSNHPDYSLWINGGWGDLSLRERRQGWTALMPVAAKVRLIEAQSLSSFVTRARRADQVWLEGLKVESWRFLMAAQVGRQLGKELLGAKPAALPSGSTANFLSRLYLS